MSTALKSDRKGVVMALLCFVHCAAGRLLLSFAGLSSLAGASENMEPIFILFSFGIGMATLVPAYRRHGRPSCLAMFLSGLVCLVVLRRLRWLVVPDVFLTATGAAMIAGSHALNRKISKRCACCAREMPATNPAGS